MHEVDAISAIADRVLIDPRGSPPPVTSGLQHAPSERRSPRSGSYAGIRNTRTFNIVWVAANHGNTATVVAAPDQVLNYDGSAVVLTAP